jgi:hypothetical protein
MPVGTYTAIVRFNVAGRECAGRTQSSRARDGPAKFLAKRVTGLRYCTEFK